MEINIFFTTDSRLFSRKLKTYYRSRNPDVIFHPFSPKPCDLPCPKWKWSDLVGLVSNLKCFVKSINIPIWCIIKEQRFYKNFSTKSLWGRNFLNRYLYGNLYRHDKFSSIWRNTLYSDFFCVKSTYSKVLYVNLTEW